MSLTPRSPTEAPPWLRVIIAAGKRRADPEPTPEPEAPRLDIAPALAAYVAAALAQQSKRVADAREGTRNVTLNNAALSLGHLVGRGVLSKGDVEAALTAAARISGIYQEDPRACAATMASGLSAGIAQPADLSHVGRRSNGVAPKPNGRHAPSHFDPVTGEVFDDPAPIQAAEPPAEPTITRTASGYPLLWFDDITANLVANDFVEGVLGNGAMSVVYGESGCGKTFYCCDLAIHVALGRPWRDRAIDVGGVIYVALEGLHGIRNRVAAFRQHYQLDDAHDVPFAVLWSAINLLDPAADAQRLVELIRETAEKIEMPVRLIVIDTLSRALAGGNENAPDDMGALVMNADAVRKASGAHLLFVHHSGKNQALGARGHSLLRAATDTEIEITKDEETKVAQYAVTKQRDLEPSPPANFKLVVVELGFNDRGKPVTSCVVTACDAPTHETVYKLRQSDRQNLLEITELIVRAGKEGVIPEDGMAAVTAVTRDQVRNWFGMRGIMAVTAGNVTGSAERMRLLRILKPLKDSGNIGIHGDWIWVVQ